MYEMSAANFFMLLASIPSYNGGKPGKEEIENKSEIESQLDKAGF